MRRDAEMQRGILAKDVDESALLGNSIFPATLHHRTAVSLDETNGSAAVASKSSRGGAALSAEAMNIERSHRGSGKGRIWFANHLPFGAVVGQVLSSGLVREMQKLLLRCTQPLVRWLCSLPSQAHVVSFARQCSSALKVALALPRRGCGWAGVSCLFSDHHSDLLPAPLASSAIHAVESLALLLRAALKEDDSGRSQHALLAAARSLLSLEFALNEFQHLASSVQLDGTGIGSQREPRPVSSSSSSSSSRRFGIRRLKSPAAFQEIAFAVDDALEMLVRDYSDVLMCQCRQAVDEAHLTSHRYQHQMQQSKNALSEMDSLLPRQLLGALLSRVEAQQQIRR